MEGSKLKNIILTVLVITNLLLALLMVHQRLASRHLRQQTLRDAVALLQDQGISVDPDALPQDDFPAPMTVERDAQQEQEQFTRLLGDDTTLTQRGTVVYYQGPLGRAEVHSDGGFTVAFSPGAYPRPDQGEPPTEPLRRLGFQGLETHRDDRSATYAQTVSDPDGKTRPVYSCSVTLTYDAQGVTSLSGARLPGTPARVSTGESPLSTATLLVRFRAGLIDSGDACTAILQAGQGYTLSADDNGVLRLTPVLRLETDTGLYLLNALTGEMRRQ